MSVLKRLPLPFKRTIEKCFWPLMPSWPDEGRRIVQGPVLRHLLKRATQERRGFGRILNAGTGESGFAFLLATLPGTSQLIETDIDIGSGRALVSPKQIFFGSSLTDIPLANRSVDLVLCTEVLEHIPDDMKALDELARVLAPEGWLLISVPTPPAVPDRAHIREGYRPEDLHRMLRERGFDVLETQFCMHRFFRWILANWEKLPYRPRILIRGLSYLDRLLPLGPPMDLIILARRRS
jgi:SAM-dependent methyltransferase